MNALVGTGRLNAFRLNYLNPALKAKRAQLFTVTLDGVPVRVRWQSIAIRDVINDAPNTCQLTIDAATPPTVGQRLRVVLGVDPTYLLFAGPLQAARETYRGRVATLKKEWDCEAVDDTNRADWRRPFGAWENLSASTVAAQLVAAFAPGYSAAAVQPGLGAVTLYLDGTERVNGALRQLAKLIGGYFYWEDKVLHLFTDAEAGAPPDAITGAPGQLLDDPAVSSTSDDAQIRTRCYGKGHAEATLAAVDVGATTIPIGNAVMFNPSGGSAISEWQRLTYTGAVLGGAGAFVGPGVTPSSAPTLAGATGSGLASGTYRYGYSWVTAAGETPPSPVATIATGSVATPTVAPTFINQGGPAGYGIAGDPLASACWKPGDMVEFGYSYSTNAASNAIVPATPISPTFSVIAQTASGSYHAPGDTAKSIYLSVPHSPDPRVTFIPMWHRINGGPWYWWQGVTNHPDWAAVGSVTTRDMSSANIYAASGASPAASALVIARVDLSGIAVGPAAVTARKVYRSIADGPTLKLLTTIANNTATTYSDAAADGTLGAAPPASDTSGLPQPAGQVVPGATSIVVASTAFASSGGGWATIGNGDQVIRYSGTTGGALTGIPATGPGAIVAPVNYNSTITGAPMLTGVSGMTAAIREGAPVNLWVQVDDLGAQAALAARAGGDGIVDNLIVDERRGLPSLTALCAADLEMYARPIVTIRYACFDPKSKSGKPIRVTLPALGIDQTLTMQDVAIDTVNHRWRFVVTASTVRQSLEDIFRRLVGTLDEGF